MQQVSQALEGALLEDLPSDAEGLITYLQTLVPLGREEEAIPLLHEVYFAIADHRGILVLSLYLILTFIALSVIFQAILDFRLSQLDALLLHVYYPPITRSIP